MVQIIHHYCELIGPIAIAVLQGEIPALFLRKLGLRAQEKILELKRAIR